MSVLGVLLGLYIGVCLLFIGGIVDLVDFIKVIARDGEIDRSLLGWGIAKLMFSGFLGYLSAIALMIPGLTLIAKD